MNFLMKLFATIVVVLYMFAVIALMALPVGVGFEAGKDLYRLVYYSGDRYVTTH